MTRIQDNWKKEEDMNRTRRHGDYQEVFYRHKDKDSIIRVGKNHGPAAMDNGTHGKWFTNFDKNGSGTFGDREHFENKDQALMYAKFLARSYPNGFDTDWSSRGDNEGLYLEATAADIRDGNYDGDDLKAMTEIIDIVKRNEPISLEGIVREVDMNKQQTLNYINEPLVGEMIDEEPANNFTMR